MLVWQLLLLLGMALLANAKVLAQGKFGRRMLHSTVDVLEYNALLFGFAALFCAFFGGRPRLPSGTTVGLAAAFGLFSVVFQLAYLSAMKCGSVSLTVLLSNFSVIPTALFGVWAYGEEITAFRAVGLLLALLSFFLTVKREPAESPFRWRWLCLALLAAVSSSAGMILQKVHQHTPCSEERTGFVTCAYAVSVLASVAAAWALRRKGQARSFRFSHTVWLPTAGAGACLGAYQLLSLYLAKQMDSLVMYPVNACAGILVGFLLGAVFFRDRLTLRQWLGSAVGIAAVVLVGL